MEERVVTGHVADDARLDDGVAPGKGSTEPSQASNPQASDAAAGPGPIVEPGKNDPDYSPAYQDEYQRLWHKAAAQRDAAEAEVVRLTEALRSSVEGKT